MNILAKIAIAHKSWIYKNNGSVKFYNFNFKPQFWLKAFATVKS